MAVIATETIFDPNRTDVVGAAFTSIARRDHLMTGLAADEAAARSVGMALDAVPQTSPEVRDRAKISPVEVGSMKIHPRELAAAGSRQVSTCTAGVPTVFLCSWTQGTGGPIRV